MQRYFGIVREAAKVVAGAVDRTVKSLADGAVEQEPAFTDRMLGRIEEAMNGFASRGVRWRAKTLTDRGPGAQERRFGADFAGVLDINLPGYQITKGFLAQAKLLRPGSRLPPAELDRLKSQCAEMLSRSPASYVFIYSDTGVSVAPALVVVGSNDGALNEHYQRSPQRFYEDHFTCFIGDQAISVPTSQMLEALPERISARQILALSAGLE